MPQAAEPPPPGAQPPQPGEVIAGRRIALEEIARVNAQLRNAPAASDVDDGPMSTAGGGQAPRELRDGAHAPTPCG